MDSSSQTPTYLHNQYKLAIEQATLAAHRLSEAKYRIPSIEFEQYLRDLRGYLRSSNKACKGTIFNGVLKLFTINCRFPSCSYQIKYDLYSVVNNINNLCATTQQKRQRNGHNMKTLVNNKSCKRVKHQNTNALTKRMNCFYFESQENVVQQRKINLSEQRRYFHKN